MNASGSAAAAFMIMLALIREGNMKFKDDYRIDRLIELMRQESVLINEEVLIYREIAEVYGAWVSQRLKEAIERDVAARRMAG
jgi:hypothetical protein